MRNWLIFFGLLISAACSAEDNVADVRSHTVVVSIAPYRYFVEKIAGDTAKVIVFVPVGASFHDYEPTPKQVFTASKADLWFRIGESFEGRVMQALQGHQFGVRFVDLRDNVSLIVVDPKDGHRCCCHANGADLHVWLSPKEAKIQSKAIAKALSETYPEHQKLYQQNLNDLLKSLDELDQYIVKTLSPLQQRIIMVGHPAYAYFARDYNLTQLPIECEGKDPTPRQLTNLLDKARAEKIKTIFTQKQYGEKAVRLVANEIGAKIVVLDPYSDDYINMMHDLADKISHN